MSKAKFTSFDAASGNKARSATRFPIQPTRWPNTRQRLEAIAKTCREKGVRVVFLTQPTIWADGLPSDVEALMGADNWPAAASSKPKNPARIG